VPLNISQVLNNRYRIVSLLAQGGMGAVYRAWDMNLRMAVALKENLETAPAASRQFEREATILANLNHPNLPRVIDYFFIPGQGQYLVMDFVEGEDLQMMIDRLGKLPEAQVLDWIDQVCSALEYLHSQPSPIIHRDIKPANIKIRPDGRAMLVDFGIAKVYDSSRSTTMGAKAVTPGFSPPEQYTGMTDARSDIYALGATLYNILTGETPPESALRAVSSLTLPPPRQLNPAISPGVEAAILTAMQIPTERRFQRMSDLRKALSQPFQPVVMQTQPAASLSTTAIPAAPARQAQPPPPHLRPVTSPASRPTTKRSAWLPGLSSMIVLVVCVAGGVAYLGLRLVGQATPPPATPVVIQPTATRLPDTPAPATPLEPTATPPAAPLEPTVTPPPLPSATRTQSQSQPNATPTPPPSPTRVLPTPTTSSPPQLLIDKSYNCRGGPGSDYELIWTFEAGALKDIIGRNSDNSWWLVRINDSRTRRQQCWVGGGVPQGDLSQVPISNWTGTVDTAKTPWP
jgi:serine/threonine protein kinase